MCTNITKSELLRKGGQNSDLKTGFYRFSECNVLIINGYTLKKTRLKITQYEKVHLSKWMS